MDILIAVLKKEGDKFNLAKEGLNAFIQKCEEKGKVPRLKRLADDPECNYKNIFRLSREIDPSIAFSSWFRDDQTAKPKGGKGTKSGKRQE